MSGISVTPPRLTLALVSKDIAEWIPSLGDAVAESVSINTHSRTSDTHTILFATGYLLFRDEKLHLIIQFTPQAVVGMASLS
ncbi:MAG: hypothetical protein WCP60_06445 [bacterium]